MATRRRLSPQRSYCAKTRGRLSPQRCYCEATNHGVGFGYNNVNGTPTCGTITIGDTKYYDGTTKTWTSEELENALKVATFTWSAP